MRTCSVDDCGNKHFAKGYCAKHYKQVQAHGRLTPELERKTTKHNLIGKRFGKLMVIKRMGRKENRSKGRIYWLCRCDCGGEIEVAAGNLIRECTRSCGCLYVESRKRRRNYYDCEDSVARSRLIRQYKRDAERRDLSFELSDRQFFELTQKNCFYCGFKPFSEQKSCVNNAPSYFYNGIDRLNNEEGYTASNVVPCCKQCNQAKMNLSLKDFIAWAGRLGDRINKMRPPVNHEPY